MNTSLISFHSTLEMPTVAPYSYTLTIWVQVQPKLQLWIASWRIFEHNPHPGVPWSGGSSAQLLQQVRAFLLEDSEELPLPSRPMRYQGIKHASHLLLFSRCRSDVGIYFSVEKFLRQHLICYLYHVLNLLNENRPLIGEEFCSI